VDQVDKVDIGTQAFIPMPVVLLGTRVAGRPNFMAVGWAARVNTSPPLIAVSVNKRHHTAEALKEGESFSLNVPGRPLAEKTDYCGLVSGRSVDKSEVFAVFYGTLADAPLIRECPLCLECLVAEVHDLPDHVLCIGEIVAAHADRECLSEGRPDARKIDPLILTMPDNSYWALGDHVGRAWGMGKPVKGA
jgi:flavin reductase (DIM6/NTAB) family NADH-FMN oxidoreductase RutF